MNQDILDIYGLRFYKTEQTLFNGSISKDGHVESNIEIHEALSWFVMEMNTSYEILEFIEAINLAFNNQFDEIERDFGVEVGSYLYSTHINKDLTLTISMFGIYDGNPHIKIPFKYPLQDMRTIFELWLAFLEKHGLD